MTRRILGYLAVAATIALLSFCGIGKARAQTTNCNVNDGFCSSRSAAESAANADADAYAATLTFGTIRCSSTSGTLPAPYEGQVRYSASVVYYENTCAQGGGFYTAERRYLPVAECPGGYQRDPQGQCLTEQRCKARNDSSPNAVLAWANTSQSMCVDGCEYSMSPETGYTTTQVTTGSGQSPLHAGVMSFSGGACSGGLTQLPEPKSQECVQAGSLTMCIQPDGDHCASASNGKQHCWKPGETGQKYDGPNVQVSNPGPTTITPNLTIPNGDTLTKTTGPATTTTTTTKSGNTSPPSTTTINNYTTINGTNASPDGKPGGGEADDGSEGDDGEDEEGATASGGNDCNTPPTSTGDPVGGAILLMVWKARCAAEGDTPAGETGNIADCNSAWSVTGTDKQANKARALRAAMCPNNPDQSGYLGDGVGEGEGGHTEVNGDMLPGGLDQAGFGWGNSCPIIPTVSVMGKTIDFNTGPFCDWMHLGGWFVLLMAALACLKMLTEAA
ncbi:MAG: virulence factor TspB C-terminal domain-related protein [Lysobacter sp.]